MDIRRCQFLKVKSMPLKVEALYSTIQEDYKKVMNFLVDGSGKGYIDWKDDVPNIIEPGNKVHNVIDAFAAGGNKAGNCYGVFYKQYKPLRGRTKKSKEYKFFKNLGDNEFFEENVGKLKSLSVEELQAYRTRLYSGESVDKLWQEASLLLGSAAGKLLPGAESLFPPASRPGDIDYCKALTDMVGASFSSWAKCHKKHLEDTALLEEKFTSKQKECGKVYECLFAYSEALEKVGYGLSKKVLTKVLKFAREQSEPEPFFAIPFNEINKHPELIAFSDKEIFTAYYTIKMYWRLRSRKKYISKPRLNDYQMPFGMTGRGYEFDMYVENGRIIFDIQGNKIQCFNSSYFSDMQVTKNGDGFLLKFRHKLKDPKKEVYKDWIIAELKEIKLLKKDGEFRVYLPYTIKYDDANFNLAKKFSKADFSAMPFARLAAVDLNINVPITATVAEWDGVAPKIIKSEIIAGETALSGELRSLVGEFKKLVQLLKDYKAAFRNKTDLDKESVEWLQSNLTGPYGNYRHQIQLLMANLNKHKKRLLFKCRKNGHNNLSENIQVLRLIDVCRSLQNSYTNLHVYDRNKYIPAKFDEKRANFRDFVSRQFGSIIVKYCQENAVNVLFREDLDVRGDFDDENNYLARLFASGQLGKRIDEALQKISIGCSAVPPDGTSRTDPVSGYVGYRDEYNKTCLYVLRNGKIGKIHADVAASLNVLLRGCDHSVYPYKFYVKKGKLVKNGKRMDAFLTKRKLSDFGTYTGYIYVTPNGFWTKQQRDAWVGQIKHLVLLNRNVENFSISGPAVCSYDAFKTREVLESS